MASQVLLLSRLLLLLSSVAAMTVHMTTHTVQAQDTTDPYEARAVNTIFNRWGISATNKWNISGGDLCTGVAVDQTPVWQINPGIKCHCSASICHITSLRVVGLLSGGQLPDELWDLTYLTDLNLGLNNLGGSIPATIKNLIRLQYLDFGTNALSGELPQELGLLTDLTRLAFGTNNFSGHLPSELGNLTRLTDLYFDSSGVSGSIPPTFGNLWSMERLWASDNELTGQIPEFIGQWSNLTELRFQGNSLQGPIPSSFIALVSLTDLRLSDISGSSSLDFLGQMDKLTTLVLRNNNISGAIPAFFSNFDSLVTLDLSFNHLTGEIPDDLFYSLNSLSNIFLGNNMLTGGLPGQRGPVLRTIDLSYNQLSGSFPSWIKVTEPNLKVNLAANNFTSSDFDNSGLSAGLVCLQRTFPCNRGSPIHSSFAINCGGPQSMSTDRVVYEGDQTLGPASSYVSDSLKWAVSNAGLAIDSSDQQYQVSNILPMTSNLDANLFQTARISAGSLRYYGLGLENGNYTVTLQFVETLMGVSGPDRKAGRRVFDIYIQGNLEVRDFDISREAGGRALSVVMREFKALVSDNYLEIHLFWAGKGTCCLPLRGTYGPSISTIRATPDFIPRVRDDTPGKNKSESGLTAGVTANAHPRSRIRNLIGLIVGIIVAVGATSLLSALYYMYKKRGRYINFGDEETLGVDRRLDTYSYAELRAATDGFNLANKLGEGGFGPVYKGILEDGRVVAVKQLSMASNHGKSQFMAEIAIISSVQHRNLVKLFGCCIEGKQLLLVYEYLENKSLDQLLFGIGRINTSYLDWPTRYNICLGVARGLAYLHEESRLRVVHRDVKASNILLDSDFNPKISDFGLAKLFDEKKTHLSTQVAGTRGYLAPEYAMFGHLTEKADVFSFGVVVLETVSGRRNADLNLEDDEIYLLELAWILHGNNRPLELVDTSLQEFDEAAVKQIIGIGLLCTQASPGLRPSMSRVVGMLTGDNEVPSVTSRPGYLVDLKFTDSTTFAGDDVRSSSNVDCSYADRFSNTSTLTYPVSSSTPMLT